MLIALLIMRFLGFPLSDSIWQVAQVAVRRSPSITLLCFYGFNLTLNFMVGSKGVYSISKSIMRQIKLGTVFKLNQNRQASEGAQL